ncbi:hypothetical protein B0T25DRAFT_457315 [Lasiosphaeria hispida]|uniref:Uncharacterized protein n=1 Tax=Lasiosphaeria hispida TaxID=260671 RepID=A0AAJ0HG91_9PEZI|nr:hypothetical protein B0T25DRAFT_457315 [Lasiosphaeria hispida]
MCELRPALSSIDPEDGLSDGAEKALAGTLDPVDRTWDSVWRLVFPADKDIPAPEFHPVVELVEVEQALDDAQETLKTGLQDKLRLLLPDTIEDSYCTFLAGQLELVYETHRANIMRQCLTRSGSTDQPAPAKAAITKRESLVRRNTRRSRRSTMIQGLRHPDTSEITSDAPPEASARLPERNLKRLSIRSSQSDQKPAAYRTETIASPPRPFSFRPISYRSTSRAETKTPSATGDNNDYSSRDSGIGIACDVCEFETCQCKFPILSLVSPRTRGSLGTPSTPTTPITPTTTWPTPKQTPSAPDTPTKPSPVATKLSSPRTYPILDSILIGSGSGNQTKHPPLRHQPRLRIRTREMDVFGPSQVEVSETASAGEMFSPQSFKRRVTMLGRGGGMSG